MGFLELTSHGLALREGALTVGPGTYGRPRINRYPGDTSIVEIGSYCSIGAGVQFTPGGGHRTDWVTTYPIRAKVGLLNAEGDGHISSKGDIRVGSDVWIGKDVHVLSGVEIGHGAVIGADSLVASSVPPYSIVAGNPSRIIRTRFTDEQVMELLRIAWWDWRQEDIIRRVDLLQSPDVDEFIRLFGVPENPAVRAQSDLPGGDSSDR